MNQPKQESSDDILKPKYPPAEGGKPSEREDEEISLPPETQPTEGEQLEEEQNTSPQGEEEDWEDELTGEKIDTPYLPSQRLAEFGMEEDMYPPKV